MRNSVNVMLVPIVEKQDSVTSNNYNISLGDNVYLIIFEYIYD